MARFFDVLFNCGNHKCIESCGIDYCTGVPYRTISHSCRTGNHVDYAVAAGSDEDSSDFSSGGAPGGVSSEGATGGAAGTCVAWLTS